MEKQFREIIQELGENCERDGLKNTPKRAAKAFRFLTQGYQEKLEDVVNNAIFDSDNREMVIVRDIELYSLCEHHLLPFLGTCHIAYLPTGKVIGLSKIARIVDLFARRLQIQETLTKQIADCIQDVTSAAGVMVVIEAKHLCMMMRGVEKQHSVMMTTSRLGKFGQEDKYAKEFLELIHSRR